MVAALAKEATQMLCSTARWSQGIHHENDFSALLIPFEVAAGSTCALWRIPLLHLAVSTAAVEVKP
jgi:hypothetical protein